MCERTSNNSETLIALVVLTAASVVSIGGCISTSTPEAKDAQLRAAMKLLGLQYGTYLSETGAPPADEAAFRKYLQAKLTILRDYGVKNVSDLLRPGRDGQPLDLFYGVKVAPSERPAYVWVAREHIGIAGKRLACDSRGGVYELTDSEVSDQLSSQ